MAKITCEEILTFLEEATILEINEVVKAIEEKFGVTAAAPVAVAAAAEVVDAGPTEVSVILKDHGASKVGVIKVVREITGLGLVDAKNLVDKLPSTIKENIKPEEAEEIKEKLTAAGALVEIK